MLSNHVFVDLALFIMGLLGVAAGVWLVREDDDMAPLVVYPFGCGLVLMFVGGYALYGRVF